MEVAVVANAGAQPQHTIVQRRRRQRQLAPLQAARPIMAVKVVVVVDITVVAVVAVFKEDQR